MFAGIGGVVLLAVPDLGGGYVDAAPELAVAVECRNDDMPPLMAPWVVSVMLHDEPADAVIVRIHLGHGLRTRRPTTRAGCQTDPVVHLNSFWPNIVAERVDVRDGLVKAYSDPGRGYHNLQHLAEVFERIDMILGSLEPEDVDRDAVLLAAWFHDAVYEQAPDNEERSAALALQELTDAGLPTSFTTEVARLVRLTATHRAGDNDTGGQVLCDADLGILAADDDRYAEYTEGVRKEYQHVPEDDFRRGRTEILRALLHAPTLFRTGFAREHWEDRARANVKRELADLER
jgi:predicted metal-dependent HD superfamily phosphohydrolase